MIRIFLFFLLSTFISLSPAGAMEGLTSTQIQRVKAAKDLLKDVDSQSLDQTVEDLLKTEPVEGNLQILEAVASVYRDMVSEYKIVGRDKKAWLHSMVQLNMAYLQLGGKERYRDTGLNLAIRQKLKEYLPEDTFKNPALFHSLNY